MLGLRIWHEILHAIGTVDPDQMVKKDVVEFTKWMKARLPATLTIDFETGNYMMYEHSPLYQKYYYTMLTEKLQK